MNIKEIQELIRFVSKSGVSEVAIEQVDFKITIKAGNGTIVHPYPLAETPSFQPPVAKVNPNSNPVSSFNKVDNVDTSNLITIKSPMVGTFYRTPGPSKENFVSIGDEISPGKIVCIIEAMKLFNDIEAEISGKIVKILAENASPVEYDQPLFLVEPV